MLGIMIRFQRLSLFLFVFACCISFQLQAAITGDAVTIEENASNYILSNGIVEATISKQSGGIVSINYQGKQLLAGRSDRASAVWSHDARSANMIVKIDHFYYSHSVGRWQFSAFTKLGLLHAGRKGY